VGLGVLQRKLVYSLVDETKGKCIKQRKSPLASAFYGLPLLVDIFVHRSSWWMLHDLLPHIFCSGSLCLKYWDGILETDTLVRVCGSRSCLLQPVCKKGSLAIPHFKYVGVELESSYLLDMYSISFMT